VRALLIASEYVTDIPAASSEMSSWPNVLRHNVAKKQKLPIHVLALRSLDIDYFVGCMTGVWNSPDSLPYWRPQFYRADKHDVENKKKL
jgi:hypothetical protein